MAKAESGSARYHIAVFNKEFQAIAQSAGIQEFFRRWPTLGDASNGVPVLAATFIRDELRHARAIGQESTRRLLLPDLMVEIGDHCKYDPPVVIATFTTFAQRDPLREASRRFRLTPRERDVLVLVLRGLNMAQIATELGLSENTVGDYFKRLRAKTGARTQSGMLAKLLGWSAPPPR